MTHSERELETIRRLRAELDDRQEHPGVFTLERMLERKQPLNPGVVRLDEQASIVYEFEWTF